MADQYIPRIAIVTGGCFEAVARHPRSVDAHRVVYIDASRDVDSVPNRDNLVPVVLARGEAIRSLLSLFDDPSAFSTEQVKKKHVDKLIKLMGTSGEKLDRGMAQIPALAYLAWEARQDVELEETLRGMVRGLAPETGGQLVDLEIMAFHSNAGGTGRGISNLAIEKIANLFEGKSITVTHYVVGRMSFTCQQIPELIQDNMPMGILEDIAFHKRPKTPKMTVHRWVGIELPPVELDEARRSLFAGLWAQAITAQETRDILDKILFARRVTAPWGAFAPIRSGWFHPQVEMDKIIRAAAEHTQKEIEQVLGGLYVRPAEESITITPGRQWDTVADEIKREFPGGKEAVKRQLERRIADCKPLIKFQHGDQETPEAELLQLPLPGSIYSDQVSCIQRLQALKQKIIAGEQERKMKTSKAQKDLDKALPLVCPQGLGEGIKAGWKSKDERDQTFEAKTRHYYEVAVEEKGFKELQGRVEVALREARKPSEAIQKALQELCQELSVAPISADSVQFKSLEKIHLDLHREARIGDRERLKEALWNSVDGFTLAGLAPFLGLETLDAAAIVVKLEKLDFDSPMPGWTAGPVWGSDQNKRDVVLRIGVFPPLTQGAFEALKAAKQEIRAKIELAQTESVAAGVGVVVLDVDQVHELKHLLPRDYEEDLKKVLKDPNKVILAHVPGADVYLDKVFEWLNVDPSYEVRELLGCQSPPSTPPGPSTGSGSGSQTTQPPATSPGPSSGSGPRRKRTSKQSASPQATPSGP